MSVGSVKESKPVFSPAEFPGLPGAAPKIIDEINHLIQQQNLAAENRGDKQEIANTSNLQSRITALTSMYTELHHSSYEVTKSAEVILAQPNQSSKSQKNSKKNKNPAQLELRDKIIGLSRTLNTQSNTEATSPQFSVTPNFLPSINVLSSKLETLNGSLNTVINNALDPEKTTDIEQLKTQLETHRNEFTSLGNQASKLWTPVNDRSKALDDFVEETKKQMATLWILKAVCDWKLDRIDIFANNHSNLEKLQKEIAGVTQKNENLKTYLRENPFNSLDLIKLKFDQVMVESGDRMIKEIKPDLEALLSEYPGEAPASVKEALRELLAGKPETKIADAKKQIQGVLEKLPQSPVDEAKLKFKSLQKGYNDCKSQAESYQDESIRSIKGLEKKLQEAEKTLVSAVEGISFNYEEVKSSVLKEMKTSISGIQGERETLHYNLNELWTKIHNQFTSNTPPHLFYGVNRMGYSIFEYNGKIPYDKTYGISWSVKNPYVTALSINDSE